MGYYECSITVAVESREAVIGILPDIGCLGMIETDTSLIAYFSDVKGIETIRKEIDGARESVRRAGLPDFSCDCLFISERDWNESWKKKFQPIDIGERLSVIPPWEAPREGRISLVVDPGMAFGTGHHETTKRCLTLIEKLSGSVKLDAPPALQDNCGNPLSARQSGGKDRFLDVGTGTGILALAARRLGYRHATAVDIDPLAVDAARRNAALNCMQEIEISLASIDAAQGTYDMITANLLSEILIRLAPEIAARLSRDGFAILSGIIEGQEGGVISAMEDVGVTTVDKIVDGRWVSLVCCCRE
jgi:ribosomal protein L11 methyltransferase